MFAKSPVPSDGLRLRQVEAEVAHLKNLVLELYQRLDMTPPAMPRPEDGDPRVVAALREGNLIVAIKLYREITGVGLADAKRDVEALAARLGVR